MKAHWIVGLVAAAGVAAVAAVGVPGIAAEQQPQAAPPAGQQPQRGAPPAAIPPPQPRPTVTAPKLPFKVIADFFKYSPDLNFGEVLGVAVNSKGQIAVLNHPGSATSGPLYGNASTQILFFDENGRFVREIGKGVYGFGYGHGIRYDKYDNLWVVDKGTHAVTKLNPAGYVTMNLGRRPEGPDEPEWFNPGRQGAAPVHVDGMFRGPTDIAFGPDDSAYISDGYTNSRIAKVDKNGDWVKSWGSRGSEPGQFRLPHNIAADRQGNVYVADRSNRRIQVFDSNGTYLRSLVLNVVYDKNRHPTLASLPANPANRPDETQPWALCITTNPGTQYLFAVDDEPGRLYKMTLDGKILGTFGESGRQVGQFNWPHAIACPSENVIYVADMNNWRIQKLVAQ